MEIMTQNEYNSCSVIQKLYLDKLIRIGYSLDSIQGKTGLYRNNTKVKLDSLSGHTLKVYYNIVEIIVGSLYLNEFTYLPNILYIEGCITVNGVEYPTIRDYNNAAPHNLQIGNGQTEQGELSFGEYLNKRLFDYKDKIEGTGFEKLLNKLINENK